MNICLFYLTLYTVCKKAYLEKYASCSPKIFMENRTSFKLLRNYFTEAAVRGCFPK